MSSNIKLLFARLLDLADGEQIQENLGGQLADKFEPLPVDPMHFLSFCKIHSEIPTLTL